jgi:hypothetical protein
MPFGQLLRELVGQYEEKAEKLRAKREREGKLDESDRTRLQATERVLHALRESQTKAARK